MQELILLTDIMSLPTMMALLENGVRLRYKTEDLLLKGLKMPPIARYSLVKSYTKYSIDIAPDNIVQRLITMQLMGMSALKLVQHNDDTTYKVVFDRSFDLATLESLRAKMDELLTHSGSQRSPVRSSFYRKAIQRTQTGGSSVNDVPTDIHSICKTLQRYQQQAKQRMVELVDMETREKEMHAAMII